MRQTEIERGRESERGERERDKHIYRHTYIESEVECDGETGNCKFGQKYKLKKYIKTMNIKPDFIAAWLSETEKYILGIFSLANFADFAVYCFQVSLRC